MLSSDSISTYRLKIQHSSQRKLNLVRTNFFRFLTHFDLRGRLEGGHVILAEITKLINTCIPVLADLPQLK
jgi:hypothetical protein